MSIRPSTCQGCASYCSVLVEEEDGHIIRVKGNPANRATEGAVCPALQITLQQQADPDRVTTPLRRRNPKKGRLEDPRFERISWDEALDEIADHMLDLHRRGVGERLVITRGRCTSINGLLFKALPDIFGTPNRITHDGVCAEAEKLATGALDGIWDYHDYDFENAECIVLWGTDPVVSNRFKSVACKVFPKLPERASVFVVSPHRSLTVERVGTESWVPIVPGTDGALALAMAHVILADDPYPIEMMIGYWNNPAFSCSDTGRWERALAKLPFFVHATTNLSETS